MNLIQILLSVSESSQAEHAGYHDNPVTLCFKSWRCFTKIRCFFPQLDDSVKYHQATGTQEAGLSVRPWTTRGHRVHLLSNSCLPFSSALVSARGHLSDMDLFWVTGALKMAISLFLIAVGDGRGARRLDAWTDMQVGKRKRMGSTRRPSTAAWARNVIAQPQYVSIMSAALKAINRFTDRSCDWLVEPTVGLVCEVCCGLMFTPSWSQSSRQNQSKRFAQAQLLRLSVTTTNRWRVAPLRRNE